MAEFAQKPISEIGFVAIAINLHGTHLALWYRIDPNGPLRVLHLGWDHDLRDEPIESFKPDRYMWADLPIDPQRAKHVAFFCSCVKKSNPDGVPYAFGDPFDRFDEHSVFIKCEIKVGLTCASFVTSVLGQAGISLVDGKGWGRHCDDCAFFDWVIKAMRGEVPDIPAARRPDHPDKLRAQVDAGAYRYQPMQIAGAVTSETIPISFRTANHLACKVRKSIPKPRNSMYYLDL